MNERNGMSQTLIEPTQKNAKIPDYQPHIDEVLTPEELI